MNVIYSEIITEDTYISQYISRHISANSDYANKDDGEITDLLNSQKIFDAAHSSYVLNLIYTYLALQLKEDASDALEKGFISLSPSEIVCYTNLSKKEIVSMCEQSHIHYLNSKYYIRKGEVKYKGSKSNLIDKGAVYTQANIAHKIVEGACINLNQHYSRINEFKVLDFACGTGRFYQEVVKHLSIKLKIDERDIVLNHLYGIDIDPVAVNITRLKALNFIGDFSIADIETIANNIVNKNALVSGVLNIEDFNAITPEDIDGLHHEGFDVIVSNPPYLVLKPNKKLSTEAWNYLQSQISYFRTSGHYIYSIEGMLNLYQLSLEAMLRMLSPNGNMGIICPSTLFADISASKLRRHLLENHSITSIEFYSEDITLFENVTQATCIFQLTKGTPTQSIEVIENSKHFSVDMQLVKVLFNAHYEIPNISKIEWGILKKLSKFKRLDAYENIRNKRGELDLTLFANYITSTPTPFRLIRGRSITEEGITDNNTEFVLPEFVDRKSEDYKKYDFQKRRLICQQISNATSSRRLRFIFCNPNDILGNSCNYISAEPETLKKLALLLNSALLNWRFKVTSSNNHINNYELDALPIIDLDIIDSEHNFESQRDLDTYICSLYGLNKTETNYILKNENI